MPYNAKKIAGRRLEGKAIKQNLIIFREIDGKFATTTNGAIVKISNGEVIPDDEPLFLFRARDSKALKILRVYRELCAEDGDTALWQVEKMNDAIQRFVDFKTEHPERMKQPGITRGM